MDACARIRGVPLRTRASIRKETVRDSGALCVKSLMRSRKELCRVSVELHTGDAAWLTEIHFVCLPGHSEGEESAVQALASLPGELGDLLASVHTHGLRDDEVLLLKDSRGRAPDRADPAAAAMQSWLRAVCVLRHSCGPQQQVSVGGALVGLLGRYAAGVRYAAELQALHRGAAAEPGQAEDDDTNQSVSSIEDDFVTALEHLEEDEAGGDAGGFTKPLLNTSGGMFHHGNQRDVASQTVPAHRRRKDLSGSRVIISSASKKSPANRTAPPEVSVTVQRLSGVESQWTLCSPRARLPSPSAPVSESESSDGSSPSPIIFLDEVGYQKSLLAKLDIPQVPGGPRERVEDSDSEVSEFFDSFDQFDDLDELSSESCTLTLPLDPGGGGGSGAEPAAKKRLSEAGTGASGSKYVSRGSSTRTMNPHRFDQPTLPADVKKPTPLKPGSPYSAHSEVPDSPRPVRTSCEESGGPLFSPVSASAFSPLADSGGAPDSFWKSSGDERDASELRKPQHLCSLYKTYSDFAGSLSREILASVCGYRSPVDISDNKNLSCVCHKEFHNPSGHLMKLSEIQETVTVARLQRGPSPSLKDGIQRFAVDLVETSLGSALRDLQKGVSSCTTTLCHLAARLTSSVFQMAFHEIGARRAGVLKERAVGGLAGFLADEAVSGALRDLLPAKRRIFGGAVARFAADLAEELVFEGMMEVCQFSHPSTPLLGAADWLFVREEEEEDTSPAVSSYASDLSESVLQEAFITLSRADVAFATRAAISVSLDNICYVGSEDGAGATHACATVASRRDDPADASPRGLLGAEDDRTVKKALLGVSGMASCVPVPQAGHALSEETCQYKSSLAHTSQTGPRRSSCSSQGRVVTTDTAAAAQTDLRPASPHPPGAPGSGVDPSLGKSFHSFSGNMVDVIVSEACELITATESKKAVPATTTTKDALSVPGADSSGGGDTPGTPPSTPRRPSDVSQEQQIKRFSKKLKGKLAKEFSPATPPPTPRDQPEPRPGARDPAAERDKDDFLLKLMRSLSEEAEGNGEEEEEEEEEDADVRGLPEAGGERSQPSAAAAICKVSNKEAFQYAERLACHIVSMATEIDTLGVAGDDDGGEGGGGRRREGARRGSAAQFSEQTLNTLWVYAGEVAGEVISDVKRMVGSGERRHRGAGRGQDRAGSDRRRLQPHPYSAPGEPSRDCRSGAAAAPAGPRPAPGPALSSDYPSCESVTDEYAGYLIRVLKTEGGARELVLDQYAGRLAYRSIKLGLAHAARDAKQRPAAARLRPPASSRRAPGSTFPPGDAGVPGEAGGQCACRDGGRREEYAELASFAESLAYGIARDVARKLRRTTAAARLPKSMTDSCLYERARLEDMTEDLIRSSFSCPLLAKEGKSRRCHSTGSLYDGGGVGAMQVIERYARKIADDTLEMTLASAGRPAQERGEDGHAPPHARRLSEGAGLDTAPGKRECPFCSGPGGGGGGHFQPAGQRRRRRQEGEAAAGRTGLDIPEIHVDLDRRAAFAEEVVSVAMETAKRELSNTSLNADSGIGHDGASFAESLTAEVMTSALANACQTANLSSPGREAAESAVSQQPSLSVGDDSLGSWSNLSFEDDHADESSSFLHLSDSSNGNSSSWSSLGLEGEACEEHLSFSYPSDSDCTEDKETQVKEESCGTVRVDRGQSQAPRALLVVNSEPSQDDPPRAPNVDPQLRSLLQWAAASMADLPLVQLGPSSDTELQQLPAVVRRLREREWRVGDLLQALLRYGEDAAHAAAPEDAPPRAGGEARRRVPLFQWLLEHA